MLALASKELTTPKRSAVAGMSCISPRAPLFETSRGLKSDSALMIAEISAASTSNFFAVSTISLSYFDVKSGPRWAS